MYTTTRTPRARALGLLIASYVLLYITYMAARSTWVSGAFQGVNSIDYIDLSLYDLANYPVINSPLGSKPAINTLLGHPAPVALLAIAAVLFTLTYFMKTGLFTIIGILTVWLAHQSVSKTTNLLLSPTGEGRFVVYEDILTTYLASCWAIMLVSGLLAVQITYIDRIERAETGEDGILDSIYAVQKTTLNRYSKVLEKKA